MNQLTTAESARKAELIETVDEGQKVFIAVGRALQEIRDSGLYRDETDTFEQFVKKRFNLSKSVAYERINACQTQADLSAIADDLPTNEAQYRVLNKVPSEKRAEVWGEVLETAANPKNITAADIKRAWAAKQTSPLTSEPVEPQPKVCKCPACDGSGMIPAAQITGDFDSLWQIVLDNTPKNSPLRANKKSAREWYPKALKIIKKENLAVDPPGFLKMRVLEFCQSETGQGKYCGHLVNRFKREFWNDPLESWDGVKSGITEFGEVPC